MRLLLDTHVVLWAAIGSPKMDDRVHTLLREADSRVISAVSAYEIAYKVRIGKLRGTQPILDGWAAVMRGLQATELSLTSTHLLKAGGLSWEHRDPFDRMLVAQAQAEGLVLMTADRIIRACEDVRTLWP